MTPLEGSYPARPLTPDTWDDFAALVEANNGVWGGCWCMAFHPAGVGRGHAASGNREAKHDLVREGVVRQMLVYDGETCVGWCQYGRPRDLPNIKNTKTYQKDLVDLPDWRIGCVFAGRRHRDRGVARTAVGAVLAAIAEEGGGVVEAYPEQTDGREPQRGSYLHTGPETLFTAFGFVRDRRIAKWRWVMRLDLGPPVAGRRAHHAQS